MNRYDIADQIRLTAEFRAAGVLTNPSGTVTLKVRDGLGVTTTYTYGVDAAVIRDSTGVYHFDLDLTSGGNWVYRWASSEGPKTGNEGKFFVHAASI